MLRPGSALSQGLSCGPLLLRRCSAGSRCLVIAGLAFLTAASTPVPLLVELVLQLFVMWVSGAGWLRPGRMHKEQKWRRMA